MMDAVVYCQHHFRQQQEHHFEEFGGGHPYYGYDEATASTSFGGTYIYPGAPFASQYWAVHVVMGRA